MAESPTFSRARGIRGRAISEVAGCEGTDRLWGWFLPSRFNNYSTQLLILMRRETQTRDRSGVTPPCEVGSLICDTAAAPSADKPQSKWRNPKLGYAFVHTVIDDHSRVAYAEVQSS